MQPVEHKPTELHHPHPVQPSQQIQKRPINYFRVASFVLLCFSLAFVGGWLGANVGLGANTVSTSPTRMANDGNLVVSKEEADIAALAENVSPSVVSIVSSGATFTGSYQAAGTGMIVSKDGYVLTNKHVVGTARSVQVVTSSGSTYEDAEVVGVDPLNDVAFIKIPNVRDLPAVQLGDSKTVRVGQQVVAIGNALGQYQNSVTSGIISGLGRPVRAGDEQGQNVETLSDLLQTDTAINSGNSGGPLLNLQGQVIGINTAIAADAQNIGFAIPIGAVKGMLAGLIETGEVERAIMGVQYLTITPEIKNEFDLSVESGDYVYAERGAAVRAGGPAAEAGIQDKDILQKVNGEPITAGKSISTLIGEYKPGDTVSITLLRGGKSLDVKVTLGAY